MKPIVGSIAIALAISGALYVGRSAPGDNRGLAIGSLLVATGCIVAVLNSWGRDLLGGPSLYLTLLLLFHFGLIWTLGFGSETTVSQVSPTSYVWVRSPYLQQSVTLACVAALTYTLVCVACARSAPVRAAPYPEDSPLDREQSGPAAIIGQAGVLLELAGLGLLLWTVARLGGASLLKGGYLKFLESAETSGVSYGIWAVGIGACFTQLGRSATRRAGLVIFLAFAVVFFPLGLRGSVLFPAVVLLATRSRLGGRVRLAPLALGTLGVLTLASIVRVSRVTGADSADPGRWYSGAISTVTELGFSLRPVTEVLRWNDGGLPHTWFVSFIAVPLRLLEKLLEWHGGPPAVDPRLFNVKVATLAGPIGGSPIAEGYDAAGLFGVVVVAAGLAWLICRVSSPGRRGVVQDAAFPIVLLPLAIAVRNSFAPVVVQVAVGLAIVVVASKTARPAPVPLPVEAILAAKDRPSVKAKAHVKNRVDA